MFKNPCLLCSSASFFSYCKGIYHCLLLKMSQGVNLNFVAWNCRGLQQIRKAKQIMNKVKKMDSKIVFLQKTHLLEKDTIRIQRRWQGSVYTASLFTDSIMRTHVSQWSYFGLLKGRWLRLGPAGGTLLYTPEKVCDIILACSVLHNIALVNGVLVMCGTATMPISISEKFLFLPVFLLSMFDLSGRGL